MGKMGAATRGQEMSAKLATTLRASNCHSLFHSVRRRPSAWAQGHAPHPHSSPQQSPLHGVPSSIS